MRQLMFRGWHREAKDMVYFGLGEDKISCESEDGERFTFYLVDGHPIMQYTGLKDKNGVEIYESDVIHVPYNRIDSQEVIFLPSGTWSCSAFDLAQCKVIGNIHQNPELLK